MTQRERERESLARVRTPRTPRLEDIYPELYVLSAIYLLMTGKLPRMVTAVHTVLVPGNCSVLPNLLGVHILYVYIAQHVHNIYVCMHIGFLISYHIQSYILYLYIIECYIIS